MIIILEVVMKVFQSRIKNRNNVMETNGLMLIEDEKNNKLKLKDKSDQINFKHFQ